MESLAKKYCEVFRGYPWFSEFDENEVLSHLIYLEKIEVSIEQLTDENNSIIGFFIYFIGKKENILPLFINEYKSIIEKPIQSNFPDFKSNPKDHIKFLENTLNQILQSNKNILYIIDVGLLPNSRQLSYQSKIVKLVLEAINKADFVLGQTIDSGFIYNMLVKRINQFNIISKLPIQNINQNHIVFSFNKKEFKNFNLILSRLSKKN